MIGHAFAIASNSIAGDLDCSDGAVKDLSLRMSERAVYRCSCDRRSSSASAMIYRIIRGPIFDVF